MRPRQAEAFGRIEQLEEKIGRTFSGLPDDILNFQHNPLACAVALGWDGVTIDEVPLALTVRDSWLYEEVNDKGKPTQVVTEVDGNRFSTFWLDVVRKE